ncbi:hypothetical protein GWK47_049798 [Chionoecetes opilio]|uniref:Uncharacterized protein n=1 Tax=Chionoecetes opilio TaxID=41210 RepID=A0A8J5CT47_CHIOP|nr:hypothetical protein GWK47_049798 [Chionoecetes opilio]
MRTAKRAGKQGTRSQATPRTQTPPTLHLEGGGARVAGGRVRQARNHPTPRSDPWEGHGRGRGRGDAPGTSTSDESSRLPLVPHGSQESPDAPSRPLGGSGGHKRRIHPPPAGTTWQPGNARRPVPALGRVRAGWGVAVRRLRRSGHQHERQIYPPPAGSTWQARKRPTPRPRSLGGSGRGWGVAVRLLRRTGHQHERRVHPPPAGSTWQARNRPTPRPGPWEGPGGGGGLLCDACDAPGTSLSDESIRLPLVPRGRPGNARRPDPDLGRVRAWLGGRGETSATPRAPARATNPSASPRSHVAGQETPNTPARPQGRERAGVGVKQGPGGTGESRAPLKWDVGVTPQTRSPPGTGIPRWESQTQAEKSTHCRSQTRE